MARHTVMAVLDAECSRLVEEVTQAEKRLNGLLGEPSFPDLEQAVRRGRELDATQEHLKLTNAMLEEARQVQSMMRHALDMEDPANIPEPPSAPSAPYEGTTEYPARRVGSRYPSSS